MNSKHSNLISYQTFFLLTLIFISGCGSFKNDNTESLNWMSKTTDIQIPDSTKNLDFYNNHEWGMIVKFQTSDVIFENFCKTYNLTQLNEDELKILLLNDIEQIPLKEQFIKKTSNYLSFSDCKTGNSWTLLANKNSKTIWFEVLYSDYGGDIAPCDKGTITSNKKETRLDFSIIRGINKIQNQNIEITNQDNYCILIKKGNNGSWTDYAEYEILNIQNNCYSLLPKSRLGIGMCKTGKWGEPLLGIGMGSDTIAYNMLKDAEIHIMNDNKNLDTLIQITEPVSYHKMPSNQDEVSSIKVTISLKEHPNFIFDTLRFDYYRTMICANSKVSNNDTLKI